ncbi:MAG: hypothetical protein RLZZ58_243 [Pseudomonadota bacterium]
MTRDLLLKLAASGVVLGFATSGCTATGMSAGIKPAKQSADATKAGKAADKARTAMTKGDGGRAIGMAEAAVASDPGNGAYRALLGQAYLNSGRFASAEAAFTEAASLGRDEPQLVIGLALAKIALNKNAEAAQLIEAHRETLPAADYGLAMALAGDLERAIYSLSDAARQNDASARTRQNLAYAYALSGRWVQARIIAAQDLSPAKLDARMAEWATSAQFATNDLRIAGLIGTEVSRDAGMPVRLALAPGAFAPTLAAAQPVADDAVALGSADTQPVVLASADPAPIADYAPPPPVSMAALDTGPTPDDLVRVSLAAAEPLMPAQVAPLDGAATPAPALAPTVLAQADAPLIRAEAAPYKSPVDVALKAVTLASAAKDGAIPVSAFNLAGPVAFNSKKPHGWAVQLGAYDSLGVAKSKWSIISATIPNLKRFPASSQSATVKGKLYYRLTANGLASRADALALCRNVQAAGQKCFVRQMAPSERVQWASNGPMRMAAR